MEKIKYLAIILFAMLAVCSFGQDNQNKEQDVLPEKDSKARAKIEAARIGMITNRLGLTPEQAEKFWPIYREFAEKRMELRKEFKSEQNSMKPEERTPDQQKKLVDLGLNLKQKELDLEKTYSTRLLNVITADQMLNLRSAERDFQRMIMQQLQHRREVQQRNENLRERNQNLHEKKN